MATDKLRRVVPPAPPPLYWLTAELKPLHDRVCEWVRAGCPTGENDILGGDEFLEYCRLRGKEDLYFFGRFVWCNDWLEPEHHAPLSYAWTVPNGHNHAGRIYGDERCAIEPRSHLKTTHLTQHWATWKIVRNPEERGLVFTHSYEFGVKLMTPIKGLLEGRGPIGKWFCALYPELVPPKSDREKWKENMLTVGRQLLYTDATLEATGSGGKLTGSHFTFAAIDDAQDRRIPKDQVRKICDQLDNIEPMMVGNSEKRIAGTPWDVGDTLHYLTNNLKSSTIVSHRQWEEQGVRLLKGPAAEALYERAMKLKKRNPYLFSCFYLTNPSEDSSRQFRKSWFRYFTLKGNDIIEYDHDGKEQRRVDIRKCHCFILVDPTSGRTAHTMRDSVTFDERDTDLVGVIVLHVGPDNTWYVTRAIGEKWSVTELIDELFSLVDYYAPKWVAIEQRGMQVMYLNVLQAEFRRRGRVFAVRDWRGGNAAKEDRVDALQPRYQNGMIFHREADNEVIARGMQELEDELLLLSAHDDVKDALSAANGIVYAPGSLRPVELRALATRDERLQRLDRASRREAKWDEERRTGDRPSEFWASA